MKKIYLSFLPVVIIFFGFLSCQNETSTKEQKVSFTDSIQQELKLFIQDNEKTSTNKKLVTDFYQEVFGNKNIEAIDTYIGETYIQHNPYLADGKGALKEALKVWFKGAPKEKIDIQHIGAEGDLVYLHTRSKNGNKVNSIIDIFRLEKGKIVEHWDVIQEVPEHAANPHPMF